MTFLRIGISSFFIIAPGIAYFSSMGNTVLLGLLIPALWGFISATGEGALGFHHLDAYGPLSPYNDETDGDLTKTGKIAAGVVAALGAILLFLAASSYIKNSHKVPVPVKTPDASPTTDGTPAPTPDSTPDVVATKTPDVAVTPSASATPGDDPTTAPVASATPEDLELERQKIKAEDKVLSRDYKGATALLDDLEKQAPNDVEILFFRFLTLQGLHEDAKAKEYADRILKDHPGSRYERRLNKFLKALELAKRREAQGGDPSSHYAVDKGASIELTADSQFSAANSGNLDPVSGAQIAQVLVARMSEGTPINLKSGTKVSALKSVHFFFKVSNKEFAWEKSRKTAGAAEVDLVWVKVNSGKQKGKTGWIVNNLKGIRSSGNSESPNRPRNVKNILGLPVIR